MRKKMGLIALAVFGFGWVSGTNAGTEVIQDYSADGPLYTPPPRPVYYTPPPVSVVIYPGCPYFYGPRYRVYGGHRYCVRRGYWQRY